MIVNIKVVPNSKQEKIEREGDKLKIHLKSKPQDNKANIELVLVLAKHFKANKNQIKILRGHKSRDKVVEIKDM